MPSGRRPRTRLSCVSSRYRWHRQRRGRWSRTLGHEMAARARGSATLAAFLLVLACAALTLSAATAAYQATVEHRVRSEVACARFAALAGIALGPSADGRPELIGTEVGQLSV